MSSTNGKRNRRSFAATLFFIGSKMIGVRDGAHCGIMIRATRADT